MVALRRRRGDDPRGVSSTDSRTLRVALPGCDICQAKSFAWVCRNQTRRGSLDRDRPARHAPSSSIRVTPMKPCLLLKAAAIWLFTTMAALSPQAQTTESANSSAVTANAVVSQTPAATARDSYIETGGSYLGLTNGYGYWAGGYTKAVYTHGSDVWNGELNVQHEFGDAGAYLAVGDSHTFNPDWYASLTMGTSGGGFFWPRYRTDAFLNKKWMGRKQFITTAGFGYYAAKDVH